MGELTMGSIVLADDDDDIRAVFAPFLRSVGHDVREAAGGREALELIERERPELLILDVWMPGCSGFEVLERLRHDPASARMKVLMLSNMGDADTRLECFEMGAADYVVKGLPLVELRDRVARLLEQVEAAPGAGPSAAPNLAATPPA